MKIYGHYYYTEISAEEATPPPLLTPLIGDPGHILYGGIFDISVLLPVSIQINFSKSANPIGTFNNNSAIVGAFSKYCENFCEISLTPLMRSLRSVAHGQEEEPKLVLRSVHNNVIMSSLRSPHGDEERSHYNNGVLRSLRSSPTHKDAILRSLRSVPVHTEGVMRSLRSAPGR